MSTPFLQPRSSQFLALTGLVYLARLCGAALVALPLASAIRASGVGQQLTGDAVLFAPGAVHLFETVRLAKPALSAALPVSCMLFVMAAVLQVLPRGAVIHSMACGMTEPAQSLASAVQRSWASFSRFVLLGGLGFLAQVAVGMLGLVAARALRQAVGGAEHAWSGDLAYALVILLSVVSIWTVGALVDLARGAHVHGLDSGDSASISACANRAWRVLLHHPVRCALAVLAPTLTVVGLAVLVGFATGALQVERGDSWRWVAVLILHQVVILGACIAEVRWLSRVDRLLRSASAL
jgi:hypothetical protein